MRATGKAEPPQKFGPRSPLISAISGKLLFISLLLPLTAFAHVGSPDVYYDGYAGPYHLLVTVRPPSVIPGIAEIQIRSLSRQPSQIEIAPLRLVGPGATIAPRPDLAEHTSEDPQVFRGKLWIMARGSWKVQIVATGTEGRGELAVPIAAVFGTSARMQKTLGGLLAGLGLLLVIGMVAIVAAANREGLLDPGVTPSPAQRRRAFVITGATAALICAVLVFGDIWWKAEASESARLSYQLPHMQVVLQNANMLQLQLQNPNGFEWKQFASELEDRDEVRLDDLIPDHGHILHLFLVRTPDMTSFWHLHPKQLQGANFSEELPSLPAGHYRAFADIVHRTGFPETQVGEIDLPDTKGATVIGDDSGARLLASSESASPLSGGYRMVWERDWAPLKTNQPRWFRFRIEDRNGSPATDMENYMGMAGHAAFIRNDGQVFAHVHPAGSVSMAAAELAQGGSSGAKSEMPVMDHPASSAEVTFPYGFPKPGDYHIFVQIKRAGKIETGSFLAHVEN